MWLTLANDLLVIFGWVQHKVANYAQFCVVGISLCPLLPGGKTCANCAVDESLNCGGGSSKLIGRKDFTVCVTQVYEMSMDLVKYPG